MSSWRELRDTGASSSWLGHKHTQTVELSLIESVSGQIHSKSEGGHSFSLVHLAGENDVITNQTARSNCTEV